MIIDLTRRDNRIREWTKDIILKIQARGSMLNISHRTDSPSSGASLPKLKDRYRSRDGAIVQTSIRFPRQLIWTAKGAGKGRGGVKGSRWTDKYGNAKTTDPNSLGKMGTGGRVAKDFFNSVIEGPGGIDELATVVAEETGDAIVNNMFIK